MPLGHFTPIDNKARYSGRVTKMCMFRYTVHANRVFASEGEPAHQTRLRDRNNLGYPWVIAAAVVARTKCPSVGTTVQITQSHEPPEFECQDAVKNNVRLQSMKSTCSASPIGPHIERIVALKPPREITPFSPEHGPYPCLGHLTSVMDTVCTAVVTPQ
jgi:hypothetical protein